MSKGKIRPRLRGQISFQEAEMNGWILEKNGFHPGEATADGNRFLSANGYMGLRGVTEEAERALYPAVTLAGVYDRYEDRWREPVNAPMPLCIRLAFGGRELALGKTEPVSHRQRIDYRDGVFERETDFGGAAVFSERFAAMDQPDLLAAR